MKEDFLEFWFILNVINVLVAIWYFIARYNLKNLKNIWFESSQIMNDAIELYQKSLFYVLTVTVVNLLVLIYYIKTYHV